MNIQELRDKDRTYMWLKGIENTYKMYIERIEKEGDFFVIEGIQFSNRGPIETMELNSHRTIPNTFILEGLKIALKKVQDEINAHEAWFKENNVQFDHDEEYGIPRYALKGC